MFLGEVDLGLGTATQIGQAVEATGLGIHPQQIAILQQAYGPAVQRFRGDVDGGRDLAGGTGETAVGDQGHLVTRLLQVAEHRHQLVQLRHAVGRRAVVAHHDDGVLIEIPRLVGGLHRVLGGEDPGRGFNHPVFGGDRRDLDHGAAQVATEQLGATCGLEHAASDGQHARNRTLPHRLPHQLAIHQRGAAQVILHLAKHRGGIQVDQVRLRQTAHQAGHGPRLLEGVHVSRAVRVHAHQQRHHV